MSITVSKLQAPNYGGQYTAFFLVQYKTQLLDLAYKQKVIRFNERHHVPYAPLSLLPRLLLSPPSGGPTVVVCYFSD